MNAVAWRRGFATAVPSVFATSLVPESLDIFHMHSSGAKRTRNTGRFRQANRVKIRNVRSPEGGLAVSPGPAKNSFVSRTEEFVIRQPTVSGYFYPSDAKLLRQALALSLGKDLKKPGLRAMGCLVPHAGYPYSGSVAGAVYRRIELPARSILLGPRHYPYGQPMAILSNGAWLTPLGPAQIDAELAAELKRACPLLREDAVAHEREHAIEVQLPFLQQLAGDFRFVPVALGTIVLAALEELGAAIAQVIAKHNEPILVVASSDMNHYESDSLTRRKDELAIEKILQVDPPGLYETVRQHGISMCGMGAAVTMLFAAQHLGASRAELVRYATSGDVTGDREAVVGYAGIIIF